MEKKIIKENPIKPAFLDRINSEDQPVLIFDGATGTSLQKLELTSESFGGMQLEGCNEILVETNPEAVKSVHRDFLSCGCDVIETNTFGATSVVLSEYGIENKAFKINQKAAQIASKLAEEFTTDLKPRYVAGSIGPTTKLPTLGHIEFDKLRDSFQEQAEGLLAGGIDLFIIETCQDILQIKAAIQAVNKAQEAYSSSIPIMVSVTMETTGTMLVGSDIQSVLTILEPFPIHILGLNCATGPAQMKDHIKYLTENSPFITSCIPNAGLPENIGGVAHYRLTPIELRIQLLHFIRDLGVRIIGGCCGTTPEHIAELNKIAIEVNECSSKRTNSVLTKTKVEPSIASIYNSIPYKQDNSFLIIGERLNASGSKKVRELLSSEDWDGLVGIARNQVKENAHVLDVNVDFVGRDGVSDMNNLVSRLVTNINLPLMLDSTEWQKMESGLKVAGGKCILNSTNYEDGNDRFFKVLKLARDFGAGIVVGTIDESGMARTAEHKVEIAVRAYQDIISYGINPHDIFYDPLALPISTGIEEDRKNGLETIKAIKKIRSLYQDVHLLLGISNISFGLNPSARITLNSVFLHECYLAGLDSAIVSPSKILPLARIDDKHKNICLDLINDRRSYIDNNCSYDPLTTLTTEFEGVSTKKARVSDLSNSKLPLEERLKKHIIEGERIGLQELLNDSLKIYKPLQIINEYLLEGMKVVGELFGSGQMQLPFVLQSAETMKAAVSFLEPYMDRIEGEKSSKGKLLIATVKGDVHDIGKNLVDIILTNNGYEVINLGIKQDVKMIVDAQKKYNADCIAMSGLLVKSTAFMKSNLNIFNDEAITIPVILGGAALTSRFVHNDCSDAYDGMVIYGKDAFTDLTFMDDYIKAKNTNQWNDLTGFSDNNKNIYYNISRDSTIKNNTFNTQPSQNKQVPIFTTERSPILQPESPIKPPFLGTRLIHSSEIPLEELYTYLDKNALFSSQWQFKKNKNQSKEEYLELIENVAKPTLDKWIGTLSEEDLIQPSVAYGYFPCGRNDNELYVFNEGSDKLLGTFQFPRQKGGNKYCIADYFLDMDGDNPTDYIPMQAVTVGHIASKYASDLYTSNSYADYLYFHGLAVQLAEALAEWTHAKIRYESGFSSLEPADIQGVLGQKYRGCRFSFGYPACPNVSDSKKQIEWLEASRIGLTIDDSDQLHPEQSTTAIIALHSKAKYFSA